MAEAGEMEMVERVARAVGPLIEGDSEIYWASEYGRPIPEQSLQRIARAAIEAMREPSEAMVSAPGEEVGWHRSIYTAMIDAALAETQA